LSFIFILFGKVVIVEALIYLSSYQVVSSFSSYFTAFHNTTALVFLKINQSLLNLAKSKSRAPSIGGHFSRASFPALGIVILASLLNCGHKTESRALSVGELNKVPLIIKFSTHTPFN
jgi:hypothetical protein